MADEGMSRNRRVLKRAVVSTPLERPARWMHGQLPRQRTNRRFFEWLAKADREYNQLICSLLAFVLKPDSNCIDVGAFEGAMLSEMVRLAPSKRHIAYEPLPRQFDRLVERFPSVDIRQAAIADPSGQTAFWHVRNAPAWSALRPYDVSTPAPPDAEYLDVPVVRLDDDLPPDYDPAVIKIDVNGTERQAIDGALRTIATHRPTLVFEHGVHRADGTTEYLYDRLCSECGLRIFTLAGRGPLSLDELRAATEEWNFVAH